MAQPNARPFREKAMKLPYRALCALPLAALWTAPAFAADAADAAQAPAEIIVTAQKRSEPLQQVPVAVRQQRRGAVGAVHVQPAPGRAAGFGHRPERNEQPGRGAAGQDPSAGDLRKPHVRRSVTQSVIYVRQHVDLCVLRQHPGRAASLTGSSAG